jgi:SAM-dependent methyltransferase
MAGSIIAGSGMISVLRYWLGRFVSMSVALPFRRGALRRRLVNGLPPGDRRRLAWECVDHLCGDEHTPQYAARIYAAFADWMAPWSAGLAERRLLEIGPGRTLGTGALLVAAGARSYVGAELFPPPPADADYYRDLRGLLERDHDLVRTAAHGGRRGEMLARFDSAVRLQDGRVAFDEDCLAFKCPVDAAAMPFVDGSFDTCLSNAALEHVRDPDAVVRESLRVLVPGGLGFHQIDFRDHLDFSRPIDFLRHDAKDWEARFGDRGRLRFLSRLVDPYEFTNRWRVGDFARAFERHGAAVLSVTRNLVRPLQPGERASLHAAFRDRSDEDLETLGALFVVRRAGRA